MRTGVFGTGSMGRNHVRRLSALPGSELVGVYDADLDAARRIAAEHGTRAFDSEEALAGEIAAGPPDPRAEAVGHLRDARCDRAL